MARGDFPSARQDQFNLRLPEGMRERLRVAAEESGRSMNAEIVSRLEASLDNDELGVLMGAEIPQDILDPTFLDKMVAEREKLEKVFEKYLGVFAGLDTTQRDELVGLLTRVQLHPEISEVLDGKPKDLKFRSKKSTQTE